MLQALETIILLCICNGNLNRHHRLRIPRRQGVHVGQDHVPRAVMAELLFVLASDDGEGAEHVAGVVPRKAVEVEIESVEAGAQVAAVGRHLDGIIAWCGRKVG